MKNRAARFTSEVPVDAPEQPTIGPEKLFMQRQYAPAFEAAFREALAALADGPRELLRRYYVEGLTIDQLAARDGIHRATAARRVDAARKVLLADVRRRASEQLQIPATEMDSLLHSVASRIDVSLRLLVDEDH
jgi:RNA polymerase sigma-70 factor (ECF subfamily)